MAGFVFYATKTLPTLKQPYAYYLEFQWQSSNTSVKLLNTLANVMHCDNTFYFQGIVDFIGYK